MAATPRIIAGISAAAVLAAVGAVVVLRSRAPEPGAGASAPEAPPGAAAARSSRGPASGDPGSPAPAPIQAAQASVVCRTLVQNWVRALEEGQTEAAARHRQDLIAQGQSGREAVEWALTSLNLPEVIQAPLKDSLHAF